MRLPPERQGRVQAGHQRVRAQEVLAQADLARECQRVQAQGVHQRVQSQEDLACLERKLARLVQDERLRGRVGKESRFQNVLQRLEPLLQLLRA